MIPKNFQISLYEGDKHPGVIVLIPTWDVFVGAEFKAVFGGRVVFHKNYTDVQMRETLNDFIRARKREWKEFTKFPTNFIDRAKKQIEERMREEYAKENQSGVDV